MADDEQFSLCWNNFNTNLSAGFHESLVRGDLVDVTLAAEGQLVKAHRLILSVCSPYFRKMFTQMPANQHAFIFLKDVSHSALKDLIQFMYCGEVNVKQDALPAFISTAEALQIKGLTETGESAPAHQSPAKEPSHVPSASSTTIPSVASSPRAKPVPRSRIQSYKLDSDDGSDHEKVVQIQATSTPASVASASSSTVMTAQVSTPQQVQILQQQPQSQKRTLQQRASITPQTTQIMKRAKLTDPLEASEPTQIQTVQIVKQITQTPQPTVSTEPEYVEMPIETINPKAEPEYADDPSEVEAIETEHEQEQSLAEQDTAEHDQEDDSAHYVEDETYGDMSKYDETYFAEGDDAKAGASGFGSESYAESGTGADQAAQGEESLLEPINDDDDDDDDDDDGLEYEYVQRGKTQYLVVRGYSFTRQYSGRQTSSWVCCQRKPLGCKVTVSTYVHSDKIDVRRTHNHPVVPDRRDDREHLKVEVKKYTKQNETGDESMFESVEDVQYVMRGKTHYLVVGGHNFTLQRNGKHHSSWECCQRKPLGCKVTVAAYRNSSRVDIRRSHNHPIVTHRERCGRLSGAMKSTIVKTETSVPPSASTPSKSVEYVWGKTTMQLMVGGHRFCRKNVYSTYTSYECCQRASHGCKVTVNTYKDDRKLSVKNAPHNHPIIAARRGASSVGGTPTSVPTTSRPVSVDLLRPVKFADTNF